MIHYDFIEKFINDLAEKYHIVEIAVDRWNATQMIQNLEGDGFTMVPFDQGFASMSGPTKYVTERSAMQMTAVYCCVRILSEAVARCILLTIYIAIKRC